MGLTNHKFARILRRNPTPAERALWGYLRRNPFGLHFSRQQIIGKWVADFFCEEWKLVIEVDGPDHQSAARKQKDFDREQEMAGMGITTMRFSNVEIFEEIEWIDEEIGLQIQRLKVLLDDSRNNVHRFSTGDKSD